MFDSNHGSDSLRFWDIDDDIFFELVDFLAVSG